MKELTHNYEYSRYYIGSVMTSLYNYFNIKQEQGESLVDCAKWFTNAKAIEDNLHGSFNLKHALDRTDECKAASQSEQKDMAQKAIGQAEAHVFLMACTSDEAVQSRKESQNDHSKGKNNYPNSVDKAVEMIRNYRGTFLRSSKRVQQWQ